MSIQEIMSTPAVTCQQDDTLQTAAQRMWEHDCGAIPVVGDGGRVIGMITDRDICMSACMQGRPLHDISVSNAMSHEVFTCRANESIDAATRLMSDRQIRRIPVVDGGNKPVGLLSLNDIARHTVSTAARKKNGADHEIAQALAAIGRPRQAVQAKGKRPPEPHQHLTL